MLPRFTDLARRKNEVVLGSLMLLRVSELPQFPTKSTPTCARQQTPSREALTRGPFSERYGALLVPRAGRPPFEAPLDEPPHGCLWGLHALGGATARPIHLQRRHWRHERERTGRRGEGGRLGGVARGAAGGREIGEPLREGEIDEEVQGTLEGRRLGVPKGERLGIGVAVLTYEGAQEVGEDGRRRRLEVR